MHVADESGIILAEFKMKCPVRDFFDFREWERKNTKIGTTDLDNSFYRFVMFCSDDIYDMKYINFNTGEFFIDKEVPMYHEPLIGFMVRTDITTLMDLKEYCRPSGMNKFF